MGFLPDIFDASLAPPDGSNLLYDPVLKITENKMSIWQRVGGIFGVTRNAGDAPDDDEEKEPVAPKPGAPLGQMPSAKPPKDQSKLAGAPAVKASSAAAQTKIQGQQTKAIGAPVQPTTPQPAAPAAKPPTPPLPTGNVQPRHTETGRYVPHPPRPDKVGTAEAVKQGWADDGWQAGRDGSPNAPGDDGRGMTDVTKQGQDGLAATGDEDDHDPGSLFESDVKADKKTGSSQPVTVGNAFQMSDYEGQLRGDHTMLGSPDPHDVSKQAAAASLHTEHGDARDAALGAMDSSKDGESGDASKQHVQAAKFHEKAATDARKSNDPMAADMHDNAAALHRKAASCHAATMNVVRNEEDETFSSDDQRKAFFGKLAAGDFGKGAAAGKASGEASKVSNFADKKGTKVAHESAGKAHREAAKAHYEAGKATTDKDMKHGHELASKGHNAKAKEHEEKAKLTTNKRQEFMVPQAVINACQCQATREALVALNAKAEGSNADVIGGDGSDQAGGEEDTDDHDYESEDTPGTGVKVKGKGKMTDNQWLASAPPNIRAAVQNAMAIEQRERMGLVHRLTANVQGQTKQRLTAKFSRLPLDELREMMAMLPPVQNFSAPEPLYFGAAGAPVDNRGSSDADDMLELPTLNFREIVEEQRGKRA